MNVPRYGFQDPSDLVPVTDVRCEKCRTAEDLTLAGESFICVQCRDKKERGRVVDEDDPALFFD